MKHWKTILQGCIIMIGLFIGAYFSKAAHAEHGKLGHLNLSTHAEMDHGTIDVAQEESIPKIVALKLLKDRMSGWNVYVQVSDFRFAPEHASQSHRAGEGHAHLYVNGSKVARMYSNWLHLPSLPPGRNEIRVSLNANDHRTLMLGKKAIDAVIIQERD